MNFSVARQPIFDQKIDVFGYELLYRSGLRFDHLNLGGDMKTLEVIKNIFLLIGFEHMTRGRKAFINFTRQLITDEVPTILPPSRVVIEIMENVSPDDEVLEACRRLKQMGYTLALDDFVYEPRFQPFLALADIVKVDFLVTRSREERRRVMHVPGIKKTRFLAEKVETMDDFKMAVELGYSYFQGYFFEKPTLVKAKEMPLNRRVYLQLLKEVNNPDLEVTELEKLVLADPSLTVKLLRLVNSAAFGLKHKVKSVKQALLLVSPAEWRKWMTLVVMHGMEGSKTDELVVRSISRAYQCEHFAGHFGMEKRSGELFLLGMLSLVDVMMESPMDEVVSDLGLPEDIQDALLDRPGKPRDLLSLIIAYEKASWEICQAMCGYYKISDKEIANTYWQSMKYAYELSNG